MEVRLATPQDAEELLEIYRYYVEHTAITFEYETPSITEFRQRIKQTLKRYPIWRLLMGMERLSDMHMHHLLKTVLHMTGP